MAISDRELIEELARRSTADFRRILEELESREVDARHRLSSPESTELLKSRYELLTSHEQFNEGDLVYWKPGLKNRNSPSYGVPAVVITVVDPPLFDNDKDSGSTYFREPLTLLLGVLRDDNDSELRIFHFDGRRFTKRSPEHLAPPSLSNDSPELA